MKGTLFWRMARMLLWTRTQVWCLQEFEAETEEDVCDLGHVTEELREQIKILSRRVEQAGRGINRVENAYRMLAQRENERLEFEKNCLDEKE